MTDNSELSDREIELLQLLATGASNKDIANELFISTNTVKVHLRHIYGKIGVSSRTEAAMYAVQSGYVQQVDKSRTSIEIEPEGLGRDGQNFSGVGRSWWLLNRSLLFIIGSLTILIVIIVVVYWQTLQNTRELETLALSQAYERWTYGQSLPEPRANFAIANFENGLYAIGGETNSGVTAFNTRYDLSTQIWDVLSEKPTPVADVQSVQIGGKFYIPGGRKTDGNVIDTLEVYDPRDDSWMEVSSLPKPLSAYSIAASEGKMYLFGGWDGSQYVEDVYSYDPDADEWDKIDDLPSARGFSSAVVLGGKIYVLGGVDNVGEPLSNVEIFDPVEQGSGSSPWGAGFQLPQGRYAMGAVSVLDNIYLLGGISSSNQGVPALVYSASNPGWQPFFTPEDTSNWGRLGMTAVQDRLYVLGGEKDNQLTSLLLEYQAIFTINLPLILPPGQ